MGSLVDPDARRAVPQGTFAVLGLIALGLIAMAGIAIYGLVTLAINRPDTSPPGIGALSIVAYKLIDAVLGWGDRVFRWTRGFEVDTPEEEPAHA